MHPIERLNKRQSRYEKRVEEFSEVSVRRTQLFERARSISQVCDSVDQEDIVLQRSEGGVGTTVTIYRKDNEGRDKIKPEDSQESGVAIEIRNDTALEWIYLPWADQVMDVADYCAKEGSIDITPFGIVKRAWNIRTLNKQLNHFETTLDMIEAAAAQPELNFELSGAYKEIASMREIETPENLIT